MKNMFLGYVIGVLLTIVVIEPAIRIHNAIFEDNLTVYNIKVIK